MPSSGNWSAVRQRDGSTEIIRLRSADGALTFSEFFDRLQTDAAFADWYTAVLVDSPFTAFFWEHPALTAGSAATAVQFALVDAPVLAGLRADPQPFRKQFPGQDIVTFRSLGGDALLIAPSPGSETADCAHLAAFLRSASVERCRALWQSVGQNVDRSLGEAPLWLSTSGAGVAWLHVRLDSRPKYFQHRPYKTPSRGSGPPGGAG